MTVSIHAPARGATYNAHNPRLLDWFQSTHPQGVRLVISVCVFVQMGFNPRTRKGCDEG